MAMSRNSDDNNNNNNNKPPPSSVSTSSWWPFSSSSSLKEQWDEFYDQQRLERLSTCLQLDQILKQCQERQKSNKKQEEENVDPLESISPGLRTMKYYGWRGILTKLSSSKDEDGDAPENGDSPKKETAFQQALHDQIQNSCAREQHAVWACRAVAMGCGKELAHLKKCFEEEHPHEQEMILIVPHIGYNKNDVNDKHKSRIPCYEAQQSLGACVTANASSLLERKQQREKALSSSKQ